MMMTGRSIPLCFIYPAMLHLKACAYTRRQRWADYTMIAFGIVATAYTSVGTIKVRTKQPCGLQLPVLTRELVLSSCSNHRQGRKVPSLVAVRSCPASCSRGLSVVPRGDFFLDRRAITLSTRVLYICIFIARLGQFGLQRAYRAFRCDVHLCNRSDVRFHSVCPVRANIEELL